jgi:hypothetical protein
VTQRRGADLRAHTSCRVRSHQAEPRGRSAARTHPSPSPEGNTGREVDNGDELLAQDDGADTVLRGGHSVPAPPGNSVGLSVRGYVPGKARCTCVPARRSGARRPPTSASVCSSGGAGERTANRQRARCAAPVQDVWRRGSGQRTIIENSEKMAIKYVFAALALAVVAQVSRVLLGRPCVQGLSTGAAGGTYRVIAISACCGRRISVSSVVVVRQPHAPCPVCAGGD